MLFFLVLSCRPAVLVHASEAPQLKTASTHPIQYYLSLPEGWTKAKKWPVVRIASFFKPPVSSRKRAGLR